MTKRKRGSSASLRTDSVSPNRPRLNPQERLLNRFYEPLVLLYTLGRTRGESVRAVMPPRDHIAHLPLVDLRRTFLNDLAYMCDYDKGGETVTAIGLQSTPQKHIFWVASNAGSKTKIIVFLRTILTQIIHASDALDTAKSVTELASQCIAFATPRIKKYKSHLNPLLRRCISYLTEMEQAVEPGLIEWLQSWEHMSSPLDLCHSAYANRKSDFMGILARIGAEPTYGSNRAAIHFAFGMIRHYIGRLGYHFRAADTLVSCAPRLLNLLHDFEVCSVPVPVKSAMPPPDQLTRLDKILVRMLPAHSPELEVYQQALTDMDARYQLFHRFLDNYARPNRNSCVHAEIQVLEHFHAHGMQFACDDPFIACSKPACFCCSLYFRHHPGQVVEPVSHNKIYLNWRPPDLSTTVESIGPNHYRNILNAMSQELRKDALYQIHEKTAPKTWHPDSVTGITWSAQGEQTGQSMEEVDGALSVAAEEIVPRERYRTPPALRSVGASAFQATNEGEGGINFPKGVANDVLAIEISQSLQPCPEEFVSDSDESGGIQLER